MDFLGGACGHAAQGEPRARETIPGSWVATIASWTRRGDIVRLAHRGLGVAEFSLAAARALRRAVPFDGVCVATMDPATLLVTGHTIENGLPDSVSRATRRSRSPSTDFNKFTDLARAPRPAASLSAATGGDLDRSLRHRELRRPNGFGGDELRAALGGWGGIVLLRETGRADFTPAEVATVAALSGRLAEGLRRAMLFDALADEPSDEAPGLILLAPGQHARARERRRRGVAGRVRRHSRRDPCRRRARALGRSVRPRRVCAHLRGAG